MLYDAESSLSHDAQSSCDVETVLARQLGDLSTAAPSARTAQKQKLIHFMQDKVRKRRIGRVGVTDHM